MVTDLDLLARWRAGDQEAGRELFGRHFDGIYRFFHAKIEDVAEDLTQQTFLACQQGLEQFRGEASFRTYLFVIARRRLYSYLREKHRARAVIEPGSVSVADLGLASPSHVAAVRQEHGLLLQALRRLPLDMQIALELFYWEEMTVTEIAAVLEIPVGTVKRRVQRARARLGEALADLSSSEALLRSTVDNFERWARELQDHLGPKSPR